VSKLSLLTILGPTASGKTSLAAKISTKINGEIISADSRQVYRKMDIGTGKDFQDYIIDGVKIPHHLIDILDAGEKYNLFEFQRDAIKAIKEINGRKSTPVLCGGTGMYLESILLDYNLPPIKENKALKKELSSKSDEELHEILVSSKTLHNTSDSKNRDRMIRAIEIEKAEEKGVEMELTGIESLVIGLKGERRILKERIEARLEQRLKEGLIKEVQSLIEDGLDKETLLYYGLEYKLVGEHLFNDLSSNDMFQKLRSAIFQYSKRQMTWFRRMEKRGIKIHWLNFEDDIDENVQKVLNELSSITKT
jgi:tRNA dimethylallyltransferase